MPIEIKWCGIDFGQCLMDPSGLRNYLVIGDVCKELGEPESIDERIQRFRVLKEKYGSYGAIKEGHRDEILSYVFDGNTEAMEVFSIKEQEHLALAQGAEEALIYLREQNINTSVVAELKKNPGSSGHRYREPFFKQQELAALF